MKTKEAQKALNSSNNKNKHQTTEFSKWNPENKLEKQCTISNFKAENYPEYPYLQLISKLLISYMIQLKSRFLKMT